MTDSTNTSRSGSDTPGSHIHRRRFLRRLAIIGAVIGGVASGIVGYQTFSQAASETSQMFSIPTAVQQGAMPLEEAISRRKSI